MAGMSLPPLTWLRAFEAAERHLSFTQAAVELNLTQSAVSQHVRSLEAFLGRELFIRRTRALQLTEAGSSYLPTVREAFDLLARGTRSFTGGDPGQTLIVQCNMAFSVFWLAPRLHRLHVACPWLVLNIVTTIWDPEHHARNAGVEIRFGRPGDMSEHARRLTRDRFYPVCCPGFVDGPGRLDTAHLFDCSGVMGTWETWSRSQGRLFDRAVQQVAIQHRTGELIDPLARLAEVRPVAVAQIVNRRHRRAKLYQRPRQVRTDEPRAPCDNDLAALVALAMLLTPIRLHRTLRSVP